MFFQGLNLQLQLLVSVVLLCQTDDYYYYVSRDFKLQQYYYQVSSINKVIFLGTYCCNKYQVLIKLFFFFIFGYKRESLHSIYLQKSSMLFTTQINNLPQTNYYIKLINQQINKYIATYIQFFRFLCCVVGNRSRYFLSILGIRYTFVSINPKQEIFKVNTARLIKTFQRIIRDNNNNNNMSKITVQINNKVINGPNKNIL
eukprot:TRINITY_DN2301_c0_g2_i1.p4 TRINITY_DN2301_c0_g2~~TRINITY_DN2301_c0_g2_i1.p4  ORF type:complete len:201 (-),score=-11.32 TRINITY_DN2301_c0_g2_i1:17-619(-)